MRERTFRARSTIHPSLADTLHRRGSLSCCRHVRVTAPEPRNRGKSHFPTSIGFSTPSHMAYGTTMNRSPSSSGLLPLPGAPGSSWAVYKARFRAIFHGADASVLIAFWLFGTCFPLSSPSYHQLLQVLSTMSATLSSSLRLSTSSVLRFPKVLSCLQMCCPPSSRNSSPPTSSMQYHIPYG